MYVQYNISYIDSLGLVSLLKWGE